MLLKTTFVDWTSPNEKSDPSGPGALDLAKVSAVVEAIGNHTRLLIDGRWITVRENYEEVFKLWAAARGAHPEGNQIKSLDKR